MHANSGINRVYMNTPFLSDVVKVTYLSSTGIFLRGEKIISLHIWIKGYCIDVDVETVPHELDNETDCYLAQDKIDRETYSKVVVAQAKTSTGY